MDGLVEAAIVGKLPTVAQLLEIIEKKMLELDSGAEERDEGILIASHVPLKRFVALVGRKGIPRSCLRYRVSTFDVCLLTCRVKRSDSLTARLKRTRIQKTF